MKYPKRSQYKYAKSRYRIRNWAEYEAGFQKRGDLTIWLVDGVLHSKWRVDDVLLEFHGHPAPPELQSFRGYEVDQSGLDPVPLYGPASYPIHAATGIGFGGGYADGFHRGAPNGWLPAVEYLGVPS